MRKKGVVRPLRSPDIGSAQRRRGRPPRISRQAIAEVAAELAPSELNMQTVAERLGVSSSTLYYYVKGREGLLRLAAEPKLAALELPSVEGMAWDEWMLEYAKRMRVVVRSHPDMVGSLGIRYDLNEYNVMAHIGEAVLEVLTAAGFGVSDAFMVTDTTTTFIVGFVRRELWAEAQAEMGRGFDRELSAVFSQLPRKELPLLREAAHRLQAVDRDASFESQMRALLTGLGAACSR